MRFFGFNDIKMRYLEKVSLVICIELYHLVHLNIPDLERRYFEWTDRIFLDIKISQTISNIDISRFEIAYFFNLAHAWVPKLRRGWWHNYSTRTRLAGCTDEQSMYSLMSMLLTRPQRLVPGLKLVQVQPLRNVIPGKRVSSDPPQEQSQVENEPPFLYCLCCFGNNKLDRFPKFRPWTWPDN
jgi:hypothetical protein